MHFNSKKWNDLLFEGRNKAYGAFKLRSTSSRRHLISFFVVIAVFASGLYLYQWINSVFFDKMPVIDSAMPPISQAEMAQSLDLQQYAERQPNPVIQNQSEVGDVSQTGQPIDVENQTSSEDDQALNDILQKTLEEQILKSTQESIKSEELEPDQTYLVVDVMPQFPGGQQAMKRFMNNTMIYPADAQRRKAQGQVICSFTVDKDGTITDIQVVQKIDPLLDREAVRVLKQMPLWTPGQRLGEPVKVRFSIPFNFKI